MSTTQRQKLEAWEVERDRYAVMFSGPLEVGECRRVLSDEDVSPLLREAFTALDTAQGCLDLVAEDRKPIDLEECRDEIGHARMALYRALGYDDG